MTSPEDRVVRIGGGSAGPAKGGFDLLEGSGYRRNCFAACTHKSCVEMAADRQALGPGRAGLWVNLVPVWSAILGPLILGEIFAWYHAVALLLVLGGIAIAESGKR